MYRTCERVILHGETDFSTWDSPDDQGIMKFTKEGQSERTFVVPFEVWIPPYFSPSSSSPPEIEKTANALDQILCYPLKYGVHQGSSPTSGLPMRSESQSRTLPSSQFPDSSCSTRQFLLTHRMLKVRVAGDLGPSLFPHYLHLFLNSLSP